RLPQSVGLEWHARAVDPASLPSEENLVVVANNEVPRGDLLRMMPSAMQSLPSRDRQYLQSYYHQGEDFECLAKREGTSVSTVKGRLFRARRRLREVLVQQVREEGSSWS
ncbi:MAG: sigma factor-like helix-turn-helix DNA-binding protein, partial [Planctomycetota bacterium]|nr:sigma factor-like helix-turn-helix DNA-binding protein [Planctomycetota bacterium]